ncbi:AP-3 complex subunit mu-1 [Schistosoma japonicum]|nr:AP-3 complex subunit mu-1 [Schistosoma japonicum]
MLQSLFIINQSSEICLEKHWTKNISKAVCDTFFDAVTKYAAGDVPPVLETPSNSLIHILRNNLYFLAVCANEISPLLVIEFLDCVNSIIEDYFGLATETSVKENVVLIYEILDEMLDGGFPLATESNILKEIVRPPNFLQSLTDAVTGKNTIVGSTLPINQLSNIRWRRSGVNYTNNETYFDLIEKIDAIIDRSGYVISKEIYGSVECLVKLSGTPDLTLAFTNHRLIDDANLHPCIRFSRWKRERILSFIPPDGKFCLFNYHVSSLSPISLPIILRHNVLLREHGSRLDVVVVPKTMGKPWDIGRIEEKSVNPSMKSSVRYINDGCYFFHIINLISGLTNLPSNPVILVNFYIPQFVVSGLKIARVDMYGEKYKLFKGVKYATKAGQYEVRT